MSSARSDRNLLFGVLALQMDFLDRDALIAAVHAWVREKPRSLGQILLEQGHLAADDCALLEQLVERHLENHGQDTDRSFAALAATTSVLGELRQIADGDLEASLAQLPATPSVVRDGQLLPGFLSPSGDRFQIVRAHARGGLGEVFVARDGELNREVALKEIQARHADHPESRARFVREAEITGGLEHPGIVPVYALGQYADGRPYYAMRFIRGESLKEAIVRYHASSLSESECNLELRQLLSRFLGVCNAIAYAHSRGVLHRDLKPSNIMLGEFGETLVVDWGLAKQLAGLGTAATETGSSEPWLLPESETAADLSTGPWLLPPSRAGSELTHIGQTLGTPAYMSPEQAAGRLDELGPASDVYSLGATLYHLVTGQPPFAQPDKAEVLKRAQRGDLPLPRQVNRRVPAALEAICLRALALRPEDRYPSAKALADDLEHFLADERVAAHPESWLASSGRWMRHHRGLVGSLAACAVLGLTVAIAGWLLREASERETKEQGLRSLAETERATADVQRTEAERQRQRADRHVYFSRISLAGQAWKEGHPAQVDNLLEQTRPEATGGENFRNFEWGYLQRVRQASLLTLNGQGDWLLSVAYSPDGLRLAAAGQNGVVKVWDARTGVECVTLKEQAEDGNCVAFSPNGKHLASTGDDGTLIVWDAETGQRIQTLKGHAKKVWGVAYSPNGERLASAGADESVIVWDTQTGRPHLAIKGHTGIVRSVAFSPDGKHLASAGDDETVKVWELPSGQERFTLRRHTNRVLCVAFSPDGRWLASASADRTVKVCDARTGQESLDLHGHRDQVKGVAFSPDSQRLASGSADGLAMIWDTRTGQEILVLRGHTSPVSSVMFCPDGHCLASASFDRTVRVWDARLDPESLTLTGHTGYVNGIGFSPDGKHLASGGSDGTIRLWDVGTGLESIILKGQHRHVWGVAFSPDGRRLAAAHQDGTVTHWDVSTGRLSATFTGHTEPVRSVAFSPDGQLLASASFDKTVKLWDVRTGKESRTLQGHADQVWSVAFSPDGQLLASASEDKTVKVWDMRTGRERLTLKGHTDLIFAVAFSPDGGRLASGSFDATIRVWDLASGQEVLTLRGHNGAVWGVVFSPDGERLASASFDWTAKLWDARTGQESLTLRGHTHYLDSVCFRPDGRLLATSSADGTIRLYDASPVTEESQRASRALRYVRFLADTVGLKEDMLQQVRLTPTLSEPVRALALAFTRDYHAHPARLQLASWSVVRDAWARPGAYALALRQAEAACRQEPENGEFLTTLGVAQYRSGQLAVALKTLTESDRLNSARLKHSLPADLAFRSLAQARLGQIAEARTTLTRLRALLKTLPLDRQAEELRKEAESVVSAPP